MAEAALCQVWGAPIPGREKQALNVYNDTMQYWAGLQQEGKIERFEVVVLAPSGGEVAGFLLARGTAGVSRRPMRHTRLAAPLAFRTVVSTCSGLPDSWNSGIPITRVPGRRSARQSALGGVTRERKSNG